MPLPTLTIADFAGRDVCTVEECAALLGLSRGSTYQACRRGELPALKVGARYVIPVRRLASLLGVEIDTEQVPPQLVVVDDPGPDVA